MPIHGTTGGTSTEGGGEAEGVQGGTGTGGQAGGGPNGGVIRVDPRGMRAGADMYGYSADYCEGTESRFLSGTARLHGVWGNDDTGKQFEGTYLERVKGATDALKAVREALGGLPEAVENWAKSYTQANEDNAAISDELSRHAQQVDGVAYQPGSGASTGVAYAGAGQTGGEVTQVRQMAVRTASPLTETGQGEVGLVRQSGATHLPDGEGGHTEVHAVRQAAVVRPADEVVQVNQLGHVTAQPDHHTEVHAARQAAVVRPADEVVQVNQLGHVTASPAGVSPDGEVTEVRMAVPRAIHTAPLAPGETTEVRMAVPRTVHTDPLLAGETSGPILAGTGVAYGETTGFLPAATVAPEPPPVRVTVPPEPPPVVLHENPEPPPVVLHENPDPPPAAVHERPEPPPR